jgi:hypothetical protein
VTQLARTSIRFRRFEISEDRFQQLVTQIDDAAERVTLEIYGPNIQVDVVLESGSLLVRITLIGTLLWGGYDAVSKYKDFKEGAVELAQDAQKYGSTIYNEVLKLTGQQKADRVDIKDMTPGKITRVIQRLEKVHELEKKGPDRVVQDELQQIAREAQAIKRDLEPEETKSFDDWLKSKGLPPLEKLPKPHPEHKEEGAVLRKREVQEIRPPRGLRSREKKLRYHNRFVAGRRKPT